MIFKEIRDESLVINESPLMYLSVNLESCALSGFLRVTPISLFAPTTYEWALLYLEAEINTNVTK